MNQVKPSENGKWVWKVKKAIVDSGTIDHVADPKEFISRRKETAIVVIDETAIWSVD